MANYEKKLIGKILLPLFVTLVFSWLTIYWSLLIDWTQIKPDSMADTLGRAISGISLYVALAITSRLVVHQALDFWARQRVKMDAPKLLKDLSSLILWLVAAVLIAAKVFAVEISGLLTASSVVIAVIGFALRTTIADIFSGISMAMEQPLKVGDWIQITGYDAGQVVETNWRATKLVTPDQLTIVVPNSQLASRPFINYSTPEPFFRIQFPILLGYDVTAHQAERILLSAVSQVTESMAVPRKPDVLIGEFKEHGVVWNVRCWMPNYPSLPPVRYEIQRRLLRNLHYSGCSVPNKALELISSEDTATKRSRKAKEFSFFRQIDIFEELTLEELQILSEKCVTRLFLKGKPVVRQGEDGDSLFVVKEGKLSVIITTPEGRNLPVGHLIPGSFFGEMSLLTGSPRSASVMPDVDSVVLEVTKETFRQLLEKRMELVELLSKTLATRQVANQLLMQADEPPPEPEKLSGQIFKSILSFFRFSNN